jgi:tRNA(fMet)-specific endonuclease VapC
VKALLDTSAYAALMQGDAEILELLSLSETDFLPAVVLGELHSGFRLGRREAKNERQLLSFLRKPSGSVLDVTAATA